MNCIDDLYKIGDVLWAVVGENNALRRVIVCGVSVDYEIQDFIVPDYKAESFGDKKIVGFTFTVASFEFDGFDKFSINRGYRSYSISKDRLFKTKQQAIDYNLRSFVSYASIPGDC